MKIRNQANVIAVGGMCNCKNNMFRHVIVVSVILGLTEYPPESRNVPLKQKRKTGRPKENTNCYIRQPFEAYLNNPVVSSSDTSSSSISSPQPPKKNSFNNKQSNNHSSSFDIK